MKGKMYFLEEELDKLYIIPISETEYSISIYTIFDNEKNIKYFEKYVNKIIEYKEVSIEEFENKKKELLNEKYINNIKSEINKLKITENETSIVNLVDAILDYTINKKASDIHIEGLEKEVLIRVRIDGVLNNLCRINKKHQQKIISRIKILSNLDYTVKNIPQDSRFSYSFRDRTIDIRVATTPTVYGEKIVLRILDKQSIEYTRDGIGLEGENLKKVLNLITQPSGLILCVGPTGCGKSSTIYTILKYIKNDEINIITIEDPVEHKIEGINQININEKTGLSFETGLQAILRLDPDKIMVGEIRNIDTAITAMRASITGRMVFSTLHTSDCPSTIYRLLDMGLERYLISAGLIGIISQRLVRKLCTCKKKVRSYVDIYDEDLIHYEAVGCEKCNNGYLGRKAVYEILILNQEIKRAINNNATLEELTKIAIDSDMVLLKDAMKKELIEGVTSVEEIRKNIMTIGEI